VHAGAAVNVPHQQVDNLAVAWAKELTAQSQIWYWEAVAPATIQKLPPLQNSTVDQVNTSPQTHLRRPEVPLLQLLDAVQNFPLPAKKTRRDRLNFWVDKTTIKRFHSTAPATKIMCPFSVIN
jgi:hypothetical protein